MKRKIDTILDLYSIVFDEILLSKKKISFYLTIAFLSYRCMILSTVILLSIHLEK